MKKLIGVTIAEALKLENMKKVKLLAGKKGLNRNITKVNFINYEDIVGLAHEGELIFTDLSVDKVDRETLKKLIPNLSEINSAGLGIRLEKDNEEILDFIIKQAEKFNFPLIKIPNDFSFSEFINPILNEILKIQRKFLENTLNIHELLTNTILYEESIDRLAIVLVEMIKNPVLITDSNYVMISHSIPSKYEGEIKKENLLDTISKKEGVNSEKEIYGYRCKKSKVVFNNKKINLLKMPIITPDNHFGYLFVWEYDKKVNKLDLSTLKWASTIAALDILNKRSKENVELKYKNELLYDILKGKFNDKQTIINRGSNMGLKFDQGFSVLVFELKDLISKHFKDKGLLNENFQKTYLESAKRVLGQNIIMGDLGTYLIALYPGESQIREDIERFAEKILKVIDQNDRKLITVGVGNHQKDVTSLHESYSQAKRTIQVANKLNKDDRIHFFNNLGVYKLLYKIDENEKNIFLENSIVPLIKYDKAHNTELLKTLKAYFAENGNLTNVAKKVYIHYNTVHYRLKRIENITGLSLEDPDDKLNLEIALKMLNFTNLLGEGDVN